MLAMTCCLLTAPAYSQPQFKIVGGAKADPDAYPFMSALMFKAIDITTVNEDKHRTLLMSGSTDDQFSDETAFSGNIIDCSTGNTDCSNPANVTENNICLFERVRDTEGSSAASSHSQALSCQTSGGKAAIIYNDLDANQEGGGVFKDSIKTTTADTITIPVLSVSNETKPFLDEP